MPLPASTSRLIVEGWLPLPPLWPGSITITRPWSERAAVVVGVRVALPVGIMLGITLGVTVVAPVAVGAAGATGGEVSVLATGDCEGAAPCSRPRSAAPARRPIPEATPATAAIATSSDSTATTTTGRRGEPVAGRSAAIRCPRSRPNQDLRSAPTR